VGFVVEKYRHQKQDGRGVVKTKNQVCSPTIKSGMYNDAKHRKTSDYDAFAPDF
jgi:hypothetical protein